VSAAPSQKKVPLPTTRRLAAGPGDCAIVPPPQAGAGTHKKTLTHHKTGNEVFEVMSCTVAGARMRTPSSFAVIQEHLSEAAHSPRR